VASCGTAETREISLTSPIPHWWHRITVPRPKPQLVPSPGLPPMTSLRRMSAAVLLTARLPSPRSTRACFPDRINYATLTWWAHTGQMEATTGGDRYGGPLCGACLRPPTQGRKTLLITRDHGNAEVMEAATAANGRPTPQSRAGDFVEGEKAQIVWPWLPTPILRSGGGLADVPPPC